MDNNVDLVEPVTLKDLLDGGAEFVIRRHKPEPVDELERETAVKKSLLDHINYDCLDVQDDDTYQEGTPFERIARKMFNLLSNGKIKKRILVAGDGARPNYLASVEIHYNAYIEYDPEPFDSTYARNHSRRFVVNNGDVIEGLDMAVQTMQLQEKSQFLIAPEHAYKKGCLGRIPVNATVLFEVELLEILETGDALVYERLPEQKQMQFEEVYKYAEALLVQAKVLVVRNQNLIGAIKQYNIAVTKMEKVLLCSKAEQTKHALLLLRLYTNLLVCYQRTGKARNGIENARKIYDLLNLNQTDAAVDARFVISSKVYFNHAKCCRMQLDYDEAKKLLAQAHDLEPDSAEIAKEFLALEQDQMDRAKRHTKFGKALLNFQ